MPSKRRLSKLAWRTVKTPYGSNKYEHRFNKFWHALDKRKDQHVAEDTAEQKLYHFAAMRPDAPRGHAPETISKRDLRNAGMERLKRRRK